MKAIVFLCASLAAASAASAGVTVREKVSSNGYKGSGAYESEAEREVSGLKERSDAASRFTGAILKHFSGKEGSRSVAITRVDLGRRWVLDPKKKTYAESPLAAPAPEGGAGKEERAKGEEREPTARIKKVDFSVKKTGEEKTINGFATRRSVATLTVEVEDLKTKEVSSFRLVSDVWATPWTKTLRAARDEQREFAAAYAKKLGLSLSPEEGRAMAEAQVAAMMRADREEARRALAKFRAEVAKLDGYPILTESSWYFSSPSKKKAAAAQEAAADEDSPDVSGGVSGLASSLLGRAVKKKMAEKAREDEGKPEISTRVEVLEVAVKDLPRSDFEVPEGYKKR